MVAHLSNASMALFKIRQSVFAAFKIKFFAENDAVFSCITMNDYIFYEWFYIFVCAGAKCIICYYVSHMCV